MLRTEFGSRKKPRIGLTALACPRHGHRKAKNGHKKGEAAIVRLRKSNEGVDCEAKGWKYETATLYRGFSG